MTHVAGLWEAWTQVLGTHWEPTGQLRKGVFLPVKGGEGSACQDAEMSCEVFKALSRQENVAGDRGQDQVPGVRSAGIKQGRGGGERGFTLTLT